MTIEEAIKNIVTYGYYADDIPEQVAKAFDMAIAALRAQQEREKNEALTLDELREMDAPVWCLCEPIEDGYGFWCLCEKGSILVPSGNIFHVEEIPHWVFMRHKPKEDKDGKSI